MSDTKRIVLEGTAADLKRVIWPESAAIEVRAGDTEGTGLSEVTPMGTPAPTAAAGAMGCPYCAVKDREISQLKDQLSNPPAWPTLAEFLGHCESCPDHRKQLIDWLGQQQNNWVAALTTEEAKEIAKAHRLWPPPSFDLSGLIRSARKPG